MGTCKDCGYSHDKEKETCEQVTERAKLLMAGVELSRSGYAGVLPNGNIVDRRNFPDAIPMQKNSQLGVPEPKKISPGFNVCSVTGKERKNVFTYHIDAGDGELIVTKDHLIYGLECEMPDEYSMDSEYDEPDENGVIQEITIQIKKYLTQAEVDALPEKQ